MSEVSSAYTIQEENSTTYYTPRSHPGETPTAQVLLRRPRPSPPAVEDCDQGAAERGTTVPTFRGAPDTACRACSTFHKWAQMSQGW